MFNYKENEFRVATPEEQKYIDKYGHCTTWDIQQQYGITKQKCSRAIKAQKLKAFMMKDQDGAIVIRWHIVKDESYLDFIEKNKKWDSKGN